MKRWIGVALAGAVLGACVLPGDTPAPAVKSGNYTSDETANVELDSGLIRYSVDDGSPQSSRVTAFKYGPRTGPLSLAILHEDPGLGLSAAHLISIEFQDLELGTYNCARSGVSIVLTPWNSMEGQGEPSTVHSCDMTIDEVTYSLTEAQAYGHFRADSPSHIEGSFFFRVSQP